MEFYGRGFNMDEENNPTQSPPRLSIRAHLDMYEQDHLQFSPGRPSSPRAMHSMLPPGSPESPWTLSPLQTPSPALLYHCIASLHRQEGNIYSIALSKGLVFTGSDSSRIRAWRQPDCIERGYIKASYGEVRAIFAFGNMLFTTHRDCKIRIWNYTVSDNFRYKKISTLPKRSSFLQLFPKTSSQQHKDCVSCMAYYHAEGLLYTGAYDRTVKAWRLLDKKCVDSFLAHESNVNAIVVNQDDGCVFTCSSDGSGHRFAVLCLAAIEKLIFSGSEDTTIRVWRREEGSCFHECLAVLDGHRGPVRCLAACLEMEKIVMGFLVYSASLDQTFKVWRVKVMPEEKLCFDFADRNESKTAKTMEYEMSPVLSPSWVEKKLHANHFQ
ncbi:hypothetical protein COLO4_18656 [Corchorus olitorius]|uniref:Uncharacterized protein n=1 Tax=Corchorus olitorius TaxID=93759 RepID=A0A1R3J8C9_9ROSI|nr:hypothetical protein COLO4_18656 [Corchorus olitorius]